VVLGLRFPLEANADELYVLLIASDLWDGTSSFRWLVPPATSLFPDIAVSVILYALGFDGRTYFLAYSTVFVCTLYILLALLLHRSGLRRDHSWIAAALAILLICVVDPTHGYARRLLFSPAHHAGALPGGLAIVILVTDHLREPKWGWKFCLLAGLVMLMGFSDFIVLLQFILPIIAVIAIRAVLNGSEITKTAITAVSLVVFVFAGYAFKAIPNAAGIVDIPSMGLKLGRAPDAFRDFYRTLGLWIDTTGYVRLGAIVIGLGIGLCFTVVYAIRGAPFILMPVAIFTLSAIAGWLGPLVSGTYISFALVRHQLPFFVLPIVILVWFVFRYARRAQWPLAAAVLIVAAFTVQQSFALARRASLNMNPEYARLAKNLIEDRVDLVIAPFWEANRIRLGSGRSLATCVALPETTLSPWITNFGWCLEGLARWRANRGWLAVDTVVNPHSNPMIARRDVMAGVYGSPDREVTIEGRQILFYKWNPERLATIERMVCEGRKSLRVPDWLGCEKRVSANSS
jgi:hypothetical protein